MVKSHQEILLKNMEYMRACMQGISEKWLWSIFKHNILFWGHHKFKTPYNWSIIKTFISRYVLTVKLSVTEKHIIVSLDVQLRIHHWLKSNRLLWLAIPSYLIIFFLSTPLSAILRSGKTEAVRRDYFCPQLISPPRSSKLMWPHPPLL